MSIITLFQSTASEEANISSLSRPCWLSCFCPMAPMPQVEGFCLVWGTSQPASSPQRGHCTWIAAGQNHSQDMFFPRLNIFMCLSHPRKQTSLTLRMHPTFLLSPGNKFEAQGSLVYKNTTEGEDGLTQESVNQFPHLNMVYSLWVISICVSASAAKPHIPPREMRMDSDAQRSQGYRSQMQNDYGEAALWRND